MEEHIWKLTETVSDRSGKIQCTYCNELGEEHVHLADGVEAYGNPRACCWSGCSGDWPGCKVSCLLFEEIANEMLEERKEHERISEPDPFSFMLNKSCDIDENNFYVETFDTLDGTHWEIAVDIGAQILNYPDEEGREDPNFDLF